MTERKPNGTTSAASTASTDNLNPSVDFNSLPPAAQRALKEAEARRQKEQASTQPTERGGPKGEEPTRFGDWERGGRAVDF